MAERWLTFKETCIRLRIARSTLYRWMKKKLITGCKVDRRPKARWFFAEEEVQRVVTAYCNAA